MTDLKVIASFLETTMTSAGWMDDPDELISSEIEYDGKESARKTFDEANACIDFINTETGTTIKRLSEKEWERWSS